LINLLQEILPTLEVGPGEKIKLRVSGQFQKKKKKKRKRKEKEKKVNNEMLSSIFRRRIQNRTESEVCSHYHLRFQWNSEGAWPQKTPHRRNVRWWRRSWKIEGLLLNQS